jgi:hypothetical protein
MSADQKSTLKENANLAFTIITMVAVGLGSYMAKQVYEIASDTRLAVATMKSEQAAVSEKVKEIIPRPELEGRFRTTDAAIVALQADIAAVRVKQSANEIEIIKLQRGH